MNRSIGLGKVCCMFTSDLQYFKLQLIKSNLFITALIALISIICLYSCTYSFPSVRFHLLNIALLALIYVGRDLPAVPVAYGTVPLFSVGTRVSYDYLCSAFYVTQVSSDYSCSASFIRQVPSFDPFYYSNFHQDPSVIPTLPLVSQVPSDYSCSTSYISMFKSVYPSYAQILSDEPCSEFHVSHPSVYSSSTSHAR